jgi:hypothetical protein
MFWSLAAYSGVSGFKPQARDRIFSALLSLAYSFEGSDGELSETKTITASLHVCFNSLSI